MILVLAHHYDSEADWLYRTLRDECQQQACLLWPEALGLDYRISLWLRPEGKHSSTISVIEPEGAFHLESSQIRYAVNRLSYIEPLIWKGAEASEKAYASSEINAFFPAFLQSLSCPISNPVRHGALWVGAGFASKWAARLQARGIAVHPLATGTSNEPLEELNRADPATVRRWMHFQGKVFAPASQGYVPPEIARAIVELGTDEMLEYICVQDGEKCNPQLLHISRTPALSCYGRAFVDALVDHVKVSRHDHFDGNSERAADASPR